MHPSRLILCACLVGTAAAAACSSNDDDPEVPPPVNSDAGVPDTNAPDTPVFETGPVCQPTCSADGLSVLCDGGVAETCPADKSCFQGQCMDVCQKAEASHGHLGCDYYVPAPDVVRLVANGCFAAFVVNSGTDPVSLAVDRDGETFDASQFAYTISGTGRALTYTPLAGGVLPAGQRAVLFLSVGAKEDGPPTLCPTGTSVATNLDPALHGAGYGAAFHIRASAPVIAYDMYPYSGGDSIGLGSATLLLPTSSWDTNYIAVDAYTTNYSSLGRGAPWVLLAAKEDGTEVTIAPTTDLIISGPGIDPVKKGQVGRYKLNKGQTLQFEQNEEIIGSPILSNKPIGMWGGHTAMTIPADVLYADTAQQQIPPVSALGSEYVVVSHRDRYDDKPETTPYRIVAAVDGTQLTYVPSAPPGAPATLNGGQMAEFRAGAPFFVKSQDDKHPFYVAAYMTGCMEYGSSPDCRGDPEFVNVVPAKQFLDRYTFLTDPTYPETNLVVIRAKGEAGFADVTLDCAGALTGWQAVGDYEWTRFDLVRHDFQPQGGCDNGVHQMSSTAPFGVTVWGWGSTESSAKSTFVSYAYPGGMDVRPITSVVVTPVPK